MLVRLILVGFILSVVVYLFVVMICILRLLRI